MYENCQKRLLCVCTCSHLCPDPPPPRSSFSFTVFRPHTHSENPFVPAAFTDKSSEINWRDDGHVLTCHVLVALSKQLSSSLIPNGLQRSEIWQEQMGDWGHWWHFVFWLQLFSLASKAFLFSCSSHTQYYYILSSPLKPKTTENILSVKLSLKDLFLQKQIQYVKG